MTWRLMLLAIFFTAAALIWFATNSSIANRPGNEQSTAYVGAASCSASACHNAYIPRHKPGDEYTTWIAADPHAKAYEVLFNERSRRMQKNLNRAMPAHEDSLCLKCHVAPEFDRAHPPADAPYFKTDGVSCESCHGPAKQWLATHHLDAWQGKSAAEKKRLGMNDMRSLAGRAKLCATCHVGAAGMDVDHDLIAAGHPRLHFEFAAFHAALPRHWPDFKDRDPARSARGHADFDARAWLIGQLATAQASLALLAERAGNERDVWPEFAEFDCAACHHALQSPNPGAKGKRKPGAPPWTAYAALTPPILDALGRKSDVQGAIHALQESLDAGRAKREHIAKQAAKASTSLTRLLAAWDDKTPAQLPLEPLSKELRELARSDRADAITQARLGMRALRLPIPRNVGIRPFEPDALRRRLQAFRIRESTK